MNNISATIDHYLAEFARLETSLAGAGDKQITAARHAGLRRFADTGFPHKKQEDWKYTDLKTLEKQRFEAFEAAGELTAKALAPYLPEGLTGHRLVIVDGHFADNLSEIGNLPDGVDLQPLASRLSQSSNADSLGTAINGYSNPLTDMNAAFVSDGLSLTLAKNAVLEEPIHLLIVASGAREESMSQIRNVITLGANSQALLIEHYVGLGEAPYFTNAVTSVDAGPNAQLTRYRLQEESPEGGYHVSSLQAHQDKDSRVFNHGIDLGGRLVRVDTNSKLDAEGAEVHLYGVYAPTGQQHIDNHTRIDHAKPHGTSREVYKGVLAERGRGVFNGKVIVHKDAQKTDSEQSSDALLLSKKAEVDAKPELEIYADDVKCAHGSTVGQLDEDAVFYLTSRGIDEAGARAILTYSFADELIQQVQPEALRNYIKKRLLAKLPEGERYASLA